ncbi:uncharacterized protein EI90DRAFT_3046042 [Cantharellus anzutake]|uniref:uncharacterized protein n=1 Tax=Cantharellus anzutake TaxID=1750568 RepID=UPI001908066B|nr:uncharacterized protein EI90DRAFT_3046042 [Cantharellus anzutake]KAF8336520.1 hypothetical protein EI90DRAFT_3046042 [Cantharellus anzutake]
MSLPIQADLPAAEGDENQSMFHQRPRAITSAAVHGILSDLPAIEHVPTGAPWEVRRPQGRFEPHVSQPPAVRETSLPNVYSLQAFQSHPLSSTLTGATTGGSQLGSSSTRRKPGIFILAQRPGFISSGSSPLPIGAPPLRSQSSQKASRSPFPQVLSRAFSEPPPQQSGLTHVGQLAHPDAMGRYTHSESERHMFQQTASSNRGVPVSLPNVAANLPLCSMHPQQRSDDPGSLSKTVSSASTSPSSASKYWTPSEHPHYNSFPAASLLSPASTRVTVDIEPPQFLRSAPLAPHADPALQTAIMPSSARSELFRALSIEGVDPSLEASQSPLGPIGSPFIPPAPIERRPMERETFRQRIPYSSQLPATTTPSYHSSLIQRAEGDPDAHRYPSPGDLTSSGRFAGATGSSTPSLSRPLSFAPPVSSVDPFQLEAIGHLNEAMTQLELQDVATGYAEFVKNDNDKGAA